VIVVFLFIFWFLGLGDNFAISPIKMVTHYILRIFRGEVSKKIKKIWPKS